MLEKNKIDDVVNHNSRSRYWMYIAFTLFGMLVVLGAEQLYNGLVQTEEKQVNAVQPVEQSSDGLSDAVTLFPREGVELPVTWGDMGKQLTEAGVIDVEKITAVHVQGQQDASDLQMITGSDNERITIDHDNSRLLLDLFWALGLSNSNDILEEGPMRTHNNGASTDRFASTAGWRLGKGNPMSHYSAHAFMTLTDDQQQKVEDVAKNIYRPCCGNATHFPDCNHGMAMLGLLQLLSSQGVSEQQMYETALHVNSYWFPEQYMTLATYFKHQGVEWSNVEPRLVLSQQYSSSQGYQQIKQVMEPVNAPAGSSC